MTNTEWANAPWNESEPVYVTCPDCDGDGGVYYNEDGDELSVSDYALLSDAEKEKWEFCECDRCEGCGTIEE